MGSVYEDTIDQASIVLVIGGPGVGKGTQCARLAEDLKVMHVSVGDLLREEAEGPPDEQVIDIKDIMSKGSLVPAARVQSVLTGHLIWSLGSGQSKFLIDGFPRSVQQARIFEHEESAPSSLVFYYKDLLLLQGWKTKAVLHFCCSEDVMLSRMLNRAQTSGRVDDNMETFRKRYAAYSEDIVDIVQHFGNRVIEVDCQKPLDEVYGGLKSKVKTIFEFDFTRT